MLVDVVGEYAAEVLRPAAARADDDCAAPAELLTSGLEIGLPILGVPEALGGISEERSAMAGALVAEALAKGDMGLAVAALAPGAVATALSLWGTDEQQATYLPAFTGDDVPAAALALNEPAPLFDVLAPTTTARHDGDGFVLDGLKSQVPRGADAELFVVGALLDGAPTLFLVEGGTDGLTVEADPAMGLRAASMTRLALDGVRVPAGALLGATDGSTYAECVRLARLAWCALAVGTGQAVLDYVTPYVKEREAFGEPIAHRQSVAFMVADIAIELQAMRLRHLEGRLPRGRRQGLLPRGGAGAPALLRQGHADRPRRRAAARRPRLRQGAPRGAVVPRPESDRRHGRDGAGLSPTTCPSLAALAPSTTMGTPKA